ncbi:uncharacterized protein LOC6541119 [Drosophila erecta]|uniref:Uncharacterized protein n=1 Tax=Drosophila erecta TaxID=7220 RepID=B3N8A2_DROER|nr:uncharacterized protein LOC6541119 [Drosophila erecta]EDV57289.2 uncharacterized protein Dere_GG24621 [Drosophila erecta]
MTDSGSNPTEDPARPAESVEKPNKERLSKPPVRYSKAKRQFQCCVAREYYSEYSNMVDTLHITPRMMVHNKCFRVNSTYGLTLNIKNTGLFPRLINVTTDSPEDTSVSIPELELHRFLDTDETLEVKIWIRASSKRDINRRRHILVECFHPNIIFQVPIIVLDKLDSPSISDTITFPSCVPGNKSHFEMIIYNPTKDVVRVRYRNTNRGLQISNNNKDILPPKDYAKFLLVIQPKKLNVYRGFFNIKFGVLPPKPVMFFFTPKSMGVHLSIGSVLFGMTRFSREDVRSVTVCNESTHEVFVVGKFYSEPAVASDSLGKEDTLSNKLIDDAVSMHSVLLYDFEEDTSVQNVQIDAEAAKHFDYDAPARIGATSSVDIMLIFRPSYSAENPFSDNVEPPYFQRSRVTFCFSDAQECIESHNVILSGSIGGIQLEFHPKVIDFRKIYLGEEHCAQIKVLNVDDVPAKVVYTDCSDPEVSGIRITPAEGFFLDPCTRGIFNVSFYTLLPSRFTNNLRFKVQNGAHYKITLKGTGQPVQLRTFPQLVEFGSIPIAVPQKRYMLLMNPLAVPITLQVKTTEDGEETPLVLNIRSATELLPITVRDPIRHLQQVHEDLQSQKPEEQGEIRFTNTDLELLSMKSVKSSDSVYSSEFEEEVMEPIPQMAAHLLTSLKKQKIFEKSETDRRVIQEALVGLLSSKYFSVFTKHNNYIFMDWNGLPSDPREVHCDNEIIYLRPNTGRSITILLVPNKAGYFHRSLSVRICPVVASPSLESSDDHPIMKTMIKSEFLCSKLWFEYNCVVPDIAWSNMVDLSSRTIYAGEDYDFEMTFANRSIIGGFLHFDVVPNDMTFRDGTWKFFIDGGSEVTAKCAVTFRSLGNTRLSGMVNIVGASRPYPFHLFANVLPTEIRVTPMFVHQRLQVYEKSVVHFYIDNYTPTMTKLSMRLRDIEFQYLTSRGGALAASGQSMYTTLVSVFTDPDLYQNILYIDLQFDNVMMLPITFLVEGVPLHFEPDIRKGFDAGLLYTDTKEQFQESIYQHRFPVRVINRGHRAYRVLIIRLNSYGPGANVTSGCATNALTARFDMEPKNIYLSPSCEQQLDILASSYVEGYATGDFLLQVIDQKYPQRKHIIRIRTSAQFVDCQLHWIPKQLSFNYKRCEPLKERSYVETPVLVNSCSVPIHELRLQVTGPFRIKEFYEDNYEKEIQISMNGSERKEIFVILNRGGLRNQYCRQVEGRIGVFALGKQQKSLPLRLAIMVPDVVILQPDLVLFDRGQAYDSVINLVNQGCMPAEFKWKRLETTEVYIGDEDDPNGIAGEILSEILRMLEYDFSCEDQPNMTRRYQECRCQFRRFEEEGDFIMELLDEVVNDMDLRHKPLLFPPKDPPVDHEDRDQSSTSVVRETISDILNRLHIESSDQWSEVSSEYCFSSRFIYFYEKRGIVADMDMECRLHLPHIRRNHEMRAVFELVLLGGRTQRFSVTLVNLPQKIKFHRDSVYMGIKPWYETFDTTLRVSNLSRYPLQLVVAEVKAPSKEQEPEKRLVDGYCKLVTTDILRLEPLGADQIRVRGILGFSESFHHSFGAMINNSDSSYFHLRGQGVMPMLEMASPLPSTPLDSLEVAEEYRMLQKIYHYEIFRSITEVDEEPKRAEGEEECQVEERPSLTEDFSMLSLSESEMSSERRELHDLQLFRMVHTYVMVNNNQELPHATVLRQLILAERYLQRLRSKQELYELHQQVYRTYQKVHSSPGLKQSAMVKHFTVQTIPCEQHGYVLDLGSLPRNTLRRFELKLHFFGPGKLIAAARTAVRIPGLYVDFNVKDPKHCDKKLSFWAEKCTALEYFKDKYRNMMERVMDAEQDPKVKHAHSFDLDRRVQHQRDLAPKDRRLMEEYYNSLNRSVYPDHKHHFTLAKIFSGCLSNYSGVDVTMVGLFKPESRFYRKNQRVEDYIFIDLHMGPTLPILLKAVLV